MPSPPSWFDQAVKSEGGGSPGWRYCLTQLAVVSRTRPSSGVTDSDVGRRRFGFHLRMALILRWVAWCPSVWKDGVYNNDAWRSVAFPMLPTPLKTTANVATVPSTV